MEFKSFKLVQTNMSAQQYVYEGYKTEKGVHLEYYISTENWDYKSMLNSVILSANLTETKKFSENCVPCSADAK